MIDDFHPGVFLNPRSDIVSCEKKELGDALVVETSLDDATSGFAGCAGHNDLHIVDSRRVLIPVLFGPRSTYKSMKK